MRAFILAAGEGQRLRPLTNNAPKPMITLAGAPILEHNVRLLAKHGITEIVINTHYHGEAISDHFRDGSSFGVSITYSPEETLLGTAGSLIPYRDLFTETFFLLYGDNLSTCNLTALLNAHRANAADATIALFHRENATASGVVSLDDRDRITRFVEKPAKDQIFSAWVNAGILALEPSVFQFIGQPPKDFGRDVFPPMLAADRALYGYRMSEELWWIDSLEDYRRSETALEDRVL